MVKASKEAKSANTKSSLISKSGRDIKIPVLMADGSDLLQNHVRCKESVSSNQSVPFTNDHHLYNHNDLNHYSGDYSLQYQSSINKHTYSMAASGYETNMISRQGGIYCSAQGSCNCCPEPKLQSQSFVPSERGSYGDNHGYGFHEPNFWSPSSSQIRYVPNNDDTMANSNDKLRSVQRHYPEQDCYSPPPNEPYNGNIMPSESLGHFQPPHLVGAYSLQTESMDLRAEANGEQNIKYSSTAQGRPMDNWGHSNNGISGAATTNGDPRESSLQPALSSLMIASADPSNNTATSPIMACNSLNNQVIARETTSLAREKQVLSDGRLSWAPNIQSAPGPLVYSPGGGTCSELQSDNGTMEGAISRGDSQVNLYTYHSRRQELIETSQRALQQTEVQRYSNDDLAVNPPPPPQHQQQNRFPLIGESHHLNANISDGNPVSTIETSQQQQRPHVYPDSNNFESARGNFMAYPNILSAYDANTVGGSGASSDHPSQANGCNITYYSEQPQQQSLSITGGSGDQVGVFGSYDKRLTGNQNKSNATNIITFEHHSSSTPIKFPSSSSSLSIQTSTSSSSASSTYSSSTSSYDNHKSDSTTGPGSSNNNNWPAAQTTGTIETITMSSSDNLTTTNSQNESSQHYDQPPLPARFMQSNAAQQPHQQHGHNSPPAGPVVVKYQGYDATSGGGGGGSSTYNSHHQPHQPGVDGADYILPLGRNLAHHPIENHAPYQGGFNQASQQFPITY